MPDVRVGLEYHTIAGPKTRPRKRARIFVPQTRQHPDEDKQVVIGGFLTTQPQTPVAEGQLLDYVQQINQFSTVHRLFIAVDKNQDGNLTWIETEMVSTVVNQGTFDDPNLGGQGQGTPNTIVEVPPTGNLVFPVDP